MRWLLRTPEILHPDEPHGVAPATVAQAAATLEHELKLAPAIAMMLATRGITDPAAARKFLAPSLADLHSPYLMKGMSAAVDRLLAAIESKDRVLIYGDYDVDGTMATLILKTAIELCGGECEFHVPHRLLEGYGMRDDVIERAAAEGIRLIISVDTGIRAFAAAETAGRLGIDLIVTDHHLPQSEGVPRAVAVLNPNQVGCEYPCKSLCGAGVAFKVAQALLEKSGRERLIPSFLKIVAIATIADAVPLVDENRAFVRLGLEGLANPVNPGLRALLKICELDHGRPLTATEVAFRIAPRMNAAGRMDIAREVIELFTVKDTARATELAERLNQLNADRQKEEARISEAIRVQVEENPELAGASCIVLDGEGWHRGVIGICASRVVDRFFRPALVIARDGEESHGSGRSIPTFHLLEALESCPELFTRFGGHAHAVGFALPSERIPELRRRLNEFASTRLIAEDFVPVLFYDGELTLDQITPAFWESLRQLEPFGMGNPEPVFVARAVRNGGAVKVMKQKHIKINLVRYGQRQAAGALSRGLDALGWRMAERLAAEPLEAGDLLDVAFKIERNNHPDFGGGLQLILADYTIVSHAAATTPNRNWPNY